MNKTFKSLAVLILSAVLSLSAAVPALGAVSISLDQSMEQAASYLCQVVPDPQVASVGGEWSVIGLARSGLGAHPSWYDAYLRNLTATLTAQHGVLSTRKYTEYARTALCLTALGEDPRSMAGYDLIAPLEDYDKTVWQGANGAIYALIVLDSGNYATISGLRERYVQYLLNVQCPDGGWALSGTLSDPDVTAMALQALAPYRDGNQSVQTAISAGLAQLETLWAQDSFSTLESYAQTIIALCTLNILPESRLKEEFLSFQLFDGSFCHVKGGQSNLMATEQGLCALAALVRLEAGAPPLYDMSDAFPVQGDGPGQLSDQIIITVPALAALLSASALGLGIPFGPVR